MKSTLERFHMNKLNPLKDKLMQSHFSMDVRDRFHNRSCLTVYLLLLKLSMMKTLLTHTSAIPILTHSKSLCSLKHAKVVYHLIGITNKNLYKKIYTPEVKLRTYYGMASVRLSVSHIMSAQYLQKFLSDSHSTW